MGKILITVLISILPLNNISHPHEEDPFTTYIQEKLIELGYLDVDRFDNVYATGVFKSTVDFGGGSVTASGGDFDAFTLKLNSSGVFQWVRTFGDNPGDESGNDIAAFQRYSSGPFSSINYDNLITVGDFNGTVDFGIGNVTSNSSSADMFILKLNFSGNIE